MRTDINLLKEEYKTVVGAHFSEAKGHHNVFQMRLIATVTNISKNPLTLLEYRTFGPYIQNFPKHDWIDFTEKKLKDSFDEMSIKFPKPITLGLGESYSFEFKMKVYTKLKLSAKFPTPIRINKFLEVIYYNKTDLFGNKLEYSSKHVYLPWIYGQITGFTVPDFTEGKELNHHIVFKTAKSNFIVHEINWYGGSTLGLDIFYWIFDPDGDFQPNYKY